jgi:hypothetical protein
MNDHKNSVISAGRTDTTIAYLFHSRFDPSTHAVTRDSEGANLPADLGPGGWEIVKEFALGVREAMPVHIAPEPVLRGLEANGFFIWRDGSNPKGTSQ